MIIGTLTPNGELINKKEIEQSSLTSDCWLIQFNGIKECETCVYKNTEECGGGQTLVKMLNNKINTLIKLLIEIEQNMYLNKQDIQAEQDLLEKIQNILKNE